MQAVDSNVLVRYLVNDDPKQAERAGALIGRQPVFVPRTVLLETEWVLRAVYALPVTRIIAALRALAGLPGVMIEDAPHVAQAMDRADQGMDFADALHRAASAGCTSLATFDRKFIRAAKRSEGTPVRLP